MTPSSVPAADRPRLPRGQPLYQTPDIAWPTVTLFAASISLWAIMLAGGVAASWPLWLTIPVQAACIYGLFTVLHDGVHRSVSRKHPWLNELLANVSGLFLSPVAGADSFRYVHLKHHRTTNERGVDPDLWSGVGPAWRLPLQWATADISYTVYILRHLREVPRTIIVRTTVIATTMLGLYAASWAVGWGWEATLYWLIPSRLAVLWLAFAFNYLPHHPHTVEQSHNPYAATNIRRGGEPVSTALFCYQNYHLIHHLFPGLPFYHYVRIWREKRADWMPLGAQEVGLLRLTPAQAEPASKT